MPPARFLLSPLLSQPCSQKDKIPWKRDCFPGSLRSEHTGWQVVATRCTDTSQRQIAPSVLEIFVKIFVLPQQNSVAATSRTKSNRLNLCDLLPAKTKICTWIYQHTRSDLSPRSVAPSKLSPDLYTRSDLSPRNVAATCRLTCSHLKAKTATTFLGALVLSCIICLPTQQELGPLSWC